ncbi:LdpA C-terminal domain-containing domain [Leptolyngbya sp. PCC 6406]|uniref:Light dependent period protein LdpA domain-containing protein n=1 Tax=Leptolyngbya sp. PCC 6406 TaxID=1173264 RepID=UPI0002AD19A4|nr:LdpA C-terminal domain-containing domain [Leptolyngbya sp. PCC 6406]
MSEHHHPLNSLKEGRWFKLICGASYQDLPAIRSLALAYALAGADCIDVAPDPSVLAVVREALQVARTLSPLDSAFPLLENPQTPFTDPLTVSWPGSLAGQSESPNQDQDHSPWLMVSLSDGDDPHFRKATFDATHCPPTCPRPCEAICPTAAIHVTPWVGVGGVRESSCYGCGRCLPVCPPQNITTRAFRVSLGDMAAQLLSAVDAVEIHTQVGHAEQFRKLWQIIRPHTGSLKLLSISCPYGPGVVDYLWTLYRWLEPLSIPLLWQADGRPMSGDIGVGTTHAALRYGQQMLDQGPPGYVQLAGGTNAQTVAKLRMLGWRTASQQLGSLPCPSFGGVAYGGYARQLLTPLLNQLEAGTRSLSSSGAGDIDLTGLGQNILGISPCSVEYSVEPQMLEQMPDLLTQSVRQARCLVAPLKTLASAPLQPQEWEEMPPDSSGSRPRRRSEQYPRAPTLPP